MLLYIRGNAAAFTILYGRMKPALVHYLANLGSPRPSAEDLAQDVLLRVHLCREKYIGGAPLRPWLFRIAHNAYIDQQRRATRQRTYLTKDGALPEYPIDAQIPDCGFTGALIAALPDKCATAIRLTVLEGYSHAEAASRLETTRDAVKLRVHRGYKIMRKILGNESEAKARPAA